MGRYSRSKVRPSEVFPEPDSPTMPSDSARLYSRSTSLRISTFDEPNSGCAARSGRARQRACAERSGIGYTTPALSHFGEESSRR